MQDHLTTRTGYHRHNGLWLPEDLQVGDIIKCNLMTKHSGNDEAEMCRRNVMVLGLQMDPQTLEYTALHVARFSQTRTWCTDHDNFLITQSMLRRGLVRGLIDQGVMKIDRTDVVPLTQDYFYGDVYDVERIGRVSPELFGDIAESLDAGSRLPFPSISRFRGLDKNQWYLPAMHLAGEAIVSPHHKHDFTPLSEIDLARLHADWAFRKDPDKLDGDYVMKCLASIEAAHQALMRQNDYNARHKKRPSVHAPRPPLDFSRAGTVLPVEAPEPELSPEATFLMLLPHAGPGDLEGLRALGTLFNREATEPPSKLALPEHLWQGRYLMMRIADLLDHDNDGQAFRPCAVWKAYKDRDSGRLAGLELHPVTRSAHKEFSYKFQVYPLGTRSDRPSWLIADCIVRVPLDERYFHEKPDQNFFQLPPDKLEKFHNRREYVMNTNASIHTYGLQEIPENWVEVELDPVPSHQQFVKWSEIGSIRFDGNATNRVRERQRGVALR
ncbi:MAG: hypothetical protein JWO78_1037 [Micavibrio sp.]|nr:hypothetical protein [Micavibrio sp.]